MKFKELLFKNGQGNALSLQSPKGESSVCNFEHWNLEFVFNLCFVLGNFFRFRANFGLSFIANIRGKIYKTRY